MVRNHLRFGCAVLIGVFYLGSGLRGQDSVDNRWRVRDVWRLRIEGNTSFTDDDIRGALALDGPVQLTVDPQKPLHSFREAVATRTVAGYRFKGFADARANVNTSLNDTLLHLEIDEGIRFRCGDIRIEGDPDIDRAALSTALQKKAPKDYRNPSGERVDEKKWTSGDFVKLSDDWNAEMRTKVQRVLAEQGYRFADVDVSVQPDRSSHTATLLVNVIDGGGLQPVNGVTFTGLTRHSERELLEYLDLPEKLYATAALTRLIETRLLDTGRFVYVRAFAEEAFGPEQAVPLQVRLREYSKIPRLLEPLNAEQTTAVKFARWLQKLPEGDEDLRVDIRINVQHQAADVADDAAAPRLQACGVSRLQLTAFFSGRGGGLAHVKAYGNKDRLVADLTVLLGAENPGMIDWATQTKWIAPRSPGSCITTILMEGHDPTDDGHEFRFNLGMSVTSEDPTPLIASIVANPAAIVDLLLGKKHLRTLEDDGVHRFEWDGGLAEIATANGQLVNMELAGDNVRVRMSSGRRLVEAARKETCGRVLNWPNEYAQNHAVASLIRYCSGMFENTLYATEAELPELLPVVLRLLKDQPTTDEISSVIASYFGDKNFSIPWKAAPNKVSIAENWSLHALKGLVPTGSAPHRLASAVIHAARSGNGNALATILNEIRRDEEHGPLTCLLAGQLLPAYRKPLAQIGQRRLQAGQYPAELEVLLQEPCILGNLLRRSVRLLRNLNDDEFRLLLALTSSDTKNVRTDAATFEAGIRTAILLVRNHPSEHADQVLRDLLLVGWNSFVRQRVDGIFRSWLDDPEVEKIRRASFGKSVLE